MIRGALVPLLPLACLVLVAACGGERDTPTAPPATPDRVAAAVQAGLRWFERAQEEDGSFSLSRWNPHHGRPRLEGFSEEDHWFDVAATGLVILAYAEAGDPALEGAAEASVRRALRWLLTKQLDDGRFGYIEEVVDEWFVTKMRRRSLYHPDGAGYKALTVHMFNHAVATAALAEVHRTTREPALRIPLRRALRHLELDEHREYVWTSYYDPFGDVAVVPYVMLAAKAAAAAGLDREARPLLDPAPDFLDRVTDETTGRTVMLAEHPHCFDGHDSTAINALCRRLLDQDPGAPPLSLALASIARAEMAWREPGDLSDVDRPLGAVVNHELWYHGTRAFAGLSSPEGARFVERVRALLVANQCRTGTRAGSWDPIGVWDRVGGRIYATAMAVRTLAAARPAADR